MTSKSQSSIAWLRRRIEPRTISQREQARRLKTCCCCSRLGKHNCSVVDTGLEEICPKNLYKASTWETYSAQYPWAHCLWMDVVSLLILLKSVEVVDYALLSISGSKAMHLLEKSVVNMIWQLLPVSDWPIIMIGPRGLLLVVRTHFQSYGWGLLKSKWLNLDVRNIFARSHTEHRWGCS
jgi:hypothetical protein